MTIRTKILLMLTLPLLALAVVGAVGFRDQSQDQEAIEDAEVASERLSALEQLSLAVAQERLVSTAPVGGAILEAQGVTDAALADPQIDGEATFASDIARARSSIDDDRAIARYTQILWDIDGVLDDVPTAGFSPDAITRAIANRGASRGLLAQEEAWISFLGTAEFTNVAVIETTQSFTDAESRLAEAARLSLEDGTRPFERALSGPAAVELARLQELAFEDLRLGTPGEISDERVHAALTASRSEWTRTIDDNSRYLVADSLARADQISDQRSLFTLLGVLGAVLLAALVFVISRSILGPLERLISDAERMTNERLPFAVAQLRSIGANDDLPEVPAIEKETDDEIGSLVDAFNDVQVTALRVATDQARSRRNVAEMFVSLGRRNQQLLQRMLRQISDLEREENDPQTLSALYDLDHLATRMRRNAESLLVLAGNRSPRQWSRPVPVEEAVRSAIAEVEHYNRIEVGELPELAWTGSVTADVTHLLAELLENATQFSEPSTTVSIAARAIDGGTALEIADNGFGMNAEDLVANNERIANPPMLDAAPNRLLGLFVVGRLAQQHGISVSLDSQPGLGTVAHVFVPASLHDEVLDEDAVAVPPEVATPPAVAREVSPDLAGVLGSVVDQPTAGVHDFGAAREVTEEIPAAAPPPVPAFEPAEPSFPSVVPEAPVVEPATPAFTFGDLPVREPQAALSDAPGVPLPQRSSPLAAPAADSPTPESAAASVSAFMTGVSRGLDETTNETQPSHFPEDDR